MEAAASGAPTEASSRLTGAAFAALDAHHFESEPALKGHMAKALAKHWYPDDPQLAASEQGRLEGILNTKQGRALLFSADQTPEGRAKSLMTVRAEPNLTAETLKKTRSPWTNPTVVELLASERASNFVSNESMSLPGTHLENIVGVGLGIPPSVPKNATPQEEALLEAAVAAGEHSYFTEEPGASSVDTVARKLREVGGEAPKVLPLPLTFSSKETGPVPMTLFAVEHKDTGERHFVDHRGAHYESIDEYRQKAQLPPGTMTIPKDGKIQLDADGQPELETQNTPKTVDTPIEHLMRAGDMAALAGGTIAGVAMIAGTGGAAAPIVLTAASAYTATRAASGLAERQQLGMTLNPKDPEARALWIDLAASGVGAFAGVAAPVAQTAAKTGSPLAKTFATTASTLNATSSVLDAGAAVNDVHTLATNWDSMSGQERAQGILSTAFYGVSTGVAVKRAGGPRALFDPRVMRDELLRVNDGSSSLPTNDVPTQASSEVAAAYKAKSVFEPANADQTFAVSISPDGAKPIARRSDGGIPVDPSTDTVAYTGSDAVARLNERTVFDNETQIVVPEGSTVSLTHDGETITLAEPGVFMVPAGTQASVDVIEGSPLVVETGKMPDWYMRSLADNEHSGHFNDVVALNKRLLRNTTTKASALPEDIVSKLTENNLAQVNGENIEWSPVGNRTAFEKRLQELGLDDTTRQQVADTWERAQSRVLHGSHGG
ncbi:MAG: DUF4781 domain-containing protein, partial [Myxococcota bacterium]